MAACCCKIAPTSTLVDAAMLEANKYFVRKNSPWHHVTVCRSRSAESELRLTRCGALCCPERKAKMVAYKRGRLEEEDDMSERDRSPSSGEPEKPQTVRERQGRAFNVDEQREG